MFLLVASSKLFDHSGIEAVLCQQLTAALKLPCCHHSCSLQESACHERLCACREHAARLPQIPESLQDRQQALPPVDTSYSTQRPEYQLLHGPPCCATPTPTWHEPLRVEFVWAAPPAAPVRLIAVQRSQQHGHALATLQQPAPSQHGRSLRIPAAAAAAAAAAQAAAGAAAVLWVQVAEVAATVKYSCCYSLMLQHTPSPSSSNTAAANACMVFNLYFKHA
jgi:hypothetical protein